MHPIREKSAEVADIEGLECWIVPGPVEGKNGYAVFPKRPVREKGYGGILNYVPVHGGITYADEFADGMVYGFDTAHCDSCSFPRYENEWIKSQCAIMIKGIRRAAEVEDKYLHCKTNKGKAKHCDYVREVSPDSELGFGAMINLLSGEL